MARIEQGIITVAFAETGDKATLESQGVARTAGFNPPYSQPGGRKPEREVVNNELNILNNFALDVQSHGILEYNVKVNYRHPAIVFASDNNLYFSKRNNGPATNNVQDPVEDAQRTYWVNISEALSLTQVPDIDASKVTSGVFDIARIPDIPVANHWTCNSKC